MPKQVAQSQKAENNETAEKCAKLQTGSTASYRGNNPMRFYEFNQDKDIKNALMNVLMNMQGDADERDTSTEISLDAVKSIMSNTGYPAFNYEVFKKMYDQDNDLKNIVADFDRDKIIIKTDKEAEKDPKMDFDNQGSTDVVKKMAKSAMNKRK